MKNIIYIILIASIVLLGCKRKAKVDIISLENEISFVDSLNDNLTKNYNLTLQGIYKITEDSLIADSISQLVSVPDTIGFYKFIQNNISELGDIYYATQQEIYFAKDQLEELKEDVSNNQISPIQFEFELETNKKMVQQLKEFVDSKQNDIKSIQEALLVNTDSIP